uniref:ATP-dependent RNA helicase n=1 Tax=Kalanchoe fedtschenkoi TaxID=63787 RepID=A0A7N0UUH0_KALFE
MAAASPVSVSQLKRSKKSAVKKKRADVELLEQFDSLPWNSSLSNPEAFNITAGTNELDGGFLTLEEIDESEYNFEIPSIQEDSGVTEELLKPNKRKIGNGVDSETSVEGEGKGKDEVVTNSKKKIKKKKKTKSKEKKNSETDGMEKNPEILPVANEKDDHSNEDDYETLLEDAEYYAWNELRLHPLILKSIYRLGFKEPTPIQKACIPAAAHQGKDVIGAAETGSGKTLAFGIPILQRLLEEKEKTTKIVDLNGDEATNKFDRRGFLRALIITPTRELALQVTDHFKQVAKDTNTRVVPIVGGMSAEKQERLLKGRPEIVVGTPGRLWELMSRGEPHLVELHSLSFFVLDEADRMVQAGHFHELQSIIEMLPGTSSSKDELAANTQNCITVGNVQQKKRQTFVFSATIALSPDFSQKLKRKSNISKNPKIEGLNSIEVLSERAGIRANVAIIDLTKASILAEKIEESFIECREEDKDAYLYYILSVHGQGRTIVFCTSIAALRHISSILSMMKVKVSVLHAQKQQRARLKAMDRFREDDRGILIATDVAARGLDIKGVRTVVHYQLPHSAEVYVHRSGRTGRASADGCSIALISPLDKMKFASLCRSFSKVWSQV